MLEDFYFETVKEGGVEFAKSTFAVLLTSQTRWDHNVSQYICFPLTF